MNEVVICCCWLIELDVVVAISVTWVVVVSCALPVDGCAVWLFGVLDRIEPSELMAAVLVEMLSCETEIELCEELPLLLLE